MTTAGPVLKALEQWPVGFAAGAIIGPGITLETAGDTGAIVPVASLTKPLAAWALMVAAEEAAIALDEQVGVAQSGCTLRHLLAHAGGYPFDGTEPLEAPGIRRIYSNTGFDLAAQELHGRTGIDAVEYVTEAVIAPLGMTHAQLRRSLAYGMRASVDDLVLFLHEALEPRLLTDETVREMFSPQYPSLEGIVPGVGRYRPCPWGLGWEIAGDKHQHWMGRYRSPRTVGHFGGSGTMMWIDPDRRLGVIALTDTAFDQWSTSAVRAWAALSDAAIERYAPTDTA